MGGRWTDMWSAGHHGGTSLRRDHGGAVQHRGHVVQHRGQAGGGKAGGLDCVGDLDYVEVGGLDYVQVGQEEEVEVGFARFLSSTAYPEYC